MLRFPAVRVVIDYRPALRSRTGVGEYMHGLARAAVHQRPSDADEIALFTSSWRDRPSPGASADVGAPIIDRRVPVRLLNYLWHRQAWPPVERLVGAADVVHAAHPLLIPTAKAAQVVTIHDLYFLAHPERTAAEIRRDYPALAARHARRADAIVVPSRYTGSLVSGTFSVPGERVYVCSPGAPTWRTLGRQPNVPADGYVLFVGTLEPRKNVGALLDAYERLLQRRPATPDLVLAGRITPDAEAWAERWSRPPLSGHVRHLGYVPAEQREDLLSGARLLVLPSRDEGFGLPVLEAMSAGVPVVAASRGSLPEVVGEAGVLVDPDDLDAFTAALARLLDDAAVARDCAERGLARAREFSWERAAATLWQAYGDALRRRRERG
ncbi:MAG: glycosyltransferase family 4 protein [Acidimicrobiia bacterium]|nr:glycosyltransferase family 4 protein [Acidimicrobiia bacterium]